MTMEQEHKQEHVQEHMHVEKVPVQENARDTSQQIQQITSDVPKTKPMKNPGRVAAVKAFAARNKKIREEKKAKTGKYIKERDEKISARACAGRISKYVWFLFAFDCWLYCFASWIVLQTSRSPGNGESNKKGSKTSANERRKCKGSQTGQYGLSI